MMNSFLKDNNNLSEVGVNDCELDPEGIRQLSLAIGDCCNQSLMEFSFRRNEIGDSHLVDVITALSMHPQLERLNFTGNMGRNECTALSTLLRCTTSQLRVLNLYNSNIDDVGMGLVLQALRGHSLQELNMSSHNLSSKIDVWKRVATLLEVPQSNLKKLHVSYNNFGNEGALVFANALVNNSTLKTLSLQQCGITREGWTPFSKLLCDTSSVNNTYMSNHTIEKIHPANDAHVNKYLVLNKREDKQQVAMSKILQRHSHFDMQPFFEWEFKVLPIMICWFTNAARRVTTYQQKISSLRLSSTFDFIREFPMLYVEPMTRQEIAEYTAVEEKLLQDQTGVAQLEEIRHCKAQAMRRL